MIAVPTMLVIDAGVGGEPGEPLQICIKANPIIFPASRAGGGAVAGAEAAPLPAGAGAGARGTYSMKRRAVAGCMATAKQLN